MIPEVNVPVQTAGDPGAWTHWIQRLEHVTQLRQGTGVQSGHLRLPTSRSPSPSCHSQRNSDQPFPPDHGPQGNPSPLHRQLPGGWVPTREPLPREQKRDEGTEQEMKSSRWIRCSNVAGLPSPFFAVSKPMAIQLREEAVTSMPGARKNPARSPYRAPTEGKAGGCSFPGPGKELHRQGPSGSSAEHFACTVL